MNRSNTFGVFLSIAFTAAIGVYTIGVQYLLEGLMHYFADDLLVNIPLWEGLAYTGLSVAHAVLILVANHLRVK